MREERKSMLIVISGPSGVGKGTIYNKLLDNDPSLTFSVSVTTRGPRPGETDGIDYFFISDEEYEKLSDELEKIENENPGIAAEAMSAVTDEETEKELSVLYEEKRILKGIIKGADVTESVTEAEPLNSIDVSYDIKKGV